MIRYLNPAYHNAGRIRKVDKLFGDKDIKFIVKIRNIHKIERKIPSALVFLVTKMRKNTQSLCQKNVVKFYTFINTFLYDHTLHRGQLKCHIKNIFKINVKERIKMLAKGKYVRLKHYERKIKSLL